MSTVIAVFMAGLGLGAWLFGPLADRSRSPLKLYAYLELGIGVYALLLPVLLSMSMPAYVSLARQLEGQPAALQLVRVGLGFALLFVPTILMGGTFPVLVRCVIHSLARFGIDLGALYGANLVGGVVGSLLSGFVLIRWLGVQGATMVSVLGNFLVALAALVLAARTSSAGTEPETPTSDQPLKLPAAAQPLVWAAVFFSGFLGMAYEVLWTRILIFSFSSTVYSFTLILATFLTGLALGSRLFVARERRGVRPVLALAVTMTLSGITALLFTPLSTQSGDLIRAFTDRWGMTGGVFLTSTALSAAVVILVPATLMGVVLPLGMRLLVDDLGRAGRRVGGAYFVNTAGSVAGSLCAGFALIPLLGLKGGLLILAAFQVVLGWALLSHAELPRRSRLRLAAGSAGLALAGFAGAAFLLQGPNPFDTFLVRSGDGAPPVIEVHRDAVAASVSVVSYPERWRSLRIDGFEATTNKVRGRSGYMPMMSHIPMLLHPEPRRVFVICFGTGATAGAVLLHPGASLDVFDINSAVFDLAPYFLDANHGVASSLLKAASAALLANDPGRAERLGRESLAAALDGGVAAESLRWPPSLVAEPGDLTERGGTAAGSER